MACATLITLDHAGRRRSPLEPARRALGEVFGPVETRDRRRRPPGHRDPRLVPHPGLAARARSPTLEAENAALRERARRPPTSTATGSPSTTGSPPPPRRPATPWCPARVVGIGPAQSFSRTVTIDAGTRAGRRPGHDRGQRRRPGRPGAAGDQHHRHRAARSSTATPSWAAGSGSSLEAGFLRGRGVLGNDGRLDLELVDDTVVPAKGDVVVTWGSEDGAPYVAGIPVGTVTQVFTNLRETSQRAVIEPFVDFSSLDLVGVVVPSGTPQRPRAGRGRREPAMTWLRALAAGALVVVGAGAPGQRLPARRLARRRPQPRASSSSSAPALTRGPQFAMTLGFVAGVAARPRPAGRPRRRPLGAGPACWSGTSPAGSARTLRPSARRGRRRPSRRRPSSAPPSSR